MFHLRNLLAYTLAALLGLPSALADEPAPPSPAVLPEVDVVEKLDEARNRIVPNLGATSYTISQHQIEAQAQGEDAPFNQTLLRAPGVVQDSFGQLHVRGEHANLQYRINDVLLPEGITGFGAELESRFVGQLQLIDGALPAQYGFKTAGVVDIHTRSGAFDPGGRVSLYGGSFGTIQPSLQYGGSSGKLNYYFDAEYLHSDMGIENPTRHDRAIHDTTEQNREFLFLSYVIDATSRLSFFGGNSHQDFQIPNNPGQVPGFTYRGLADFDSRRLDENQHQNNAYGVLAYQKSAGDLDFQISAFERYSSVLFNPDLRGDLIFNGVAGQVRRSLQTQGLELDASYRLNDRHTLRGGFTATVAEQSARDPLAVFATDETGAQTSDLPRTIDQHDYRAGFLYGVYLQDEWKVLAPLTINFGGRFDIVDEFTHQNQLSPRLNLTLQATRSTVVHAGYARYFTPPSFEAVTPRDVSRNAGTTNAFETLRADPVRAERADYFDLGVTKTVAPGFQLGLDGYYKRAHNQIDSGQFGAAVVETEFNYREGRVYGLEFTSTYEHAGFSAYGNVALSRAEGRDIDSQQFQFAADELAYIRSYWIYLDHNQAITASAGVSYQWRDSRVSADFLYGNGLRAGFANQQKVPDFYPINLGFTQRMRIPGLGSCKLRFDVVNVLDQVYQLRSGTGVGVGASQYGTRRGFFGGLSYEF